LLKNNNINKILLDAQDNYLTFKFYYWSIHCNFKNNRGRLVIVAL